MPHLNGPIVRSRMVDLGVGFTELAALTDLPRRTLHNVTRDPGPDPISIYRAGKLLRALNPPNLVRLNLPRLKLSDILRNSKGDGVPDEPPSKDGEVERNTGPGRDSGGGTTPGKSGTKSGPRRLKDAAA